MLIESDRYSKDDCAPWNELYKADLIHGERLKRSGKIERSLDAIARFLTVGDSPVHCAVSRGKDSVVVAHLCRRVSREITLTHLRPTNHNPDCDAVRDAYFESFPGQSYWEQPVDYEDLHPRNLSERELDRETDRRWYAAIKELESKAGERVIMGLRADESTGREMRCKTWGENTRKTSAPLAFWSTADVFGYLAVEGLPVHPAYACTGGGRWDRLRLRVAEIGDTHGTGGGRREWEKAYYGEFLRRLSARNRKEIK
jgi:phosphoadenosine phosphosulfate reductase